MLTEIWAEVLKVERVGVHDNFFQLGGHSLLAVTLTERMRRRGLHADVRALFTTPTIAELATGLGGGALEVEVPPNRIPPGCDAITPQMLSLVELTQAEIDRIVAGVPGGAANVQDIYPLAPFQTGILFHHLLTREGDPYLSSFPLVFESRQQMDAYLSALRAAIGRHDILRTAVAWEGLTEPVQVVWRHAPLPVEEVELDSAAGDVELQLYDRFDSRHHRIDLRQAPLLRARVSRDAADGRWVMLLQQHHMVNDHTAMEVLTEELQAHLRGRAEELPAVQPFRNFVAQARLRVSWAEHEAFFRELLGDVEEPTAPFGLLDVRGDGPELEQASLRVEEGLGVRLRARARALGVSTASICHVAWAQVLARTSDRRDVVFGTVLFGRMQGGEGVDQMVGPFINTLPVRIDVGEGAEASVRRTQALLADLVRHEHAPLALAQQCSSVQAPAPLFSALFNYRHSSRGGRPPARRVGRGIRPVERSNYPLNLSVDDMGDKFGLTVQVQRGVSAERVCGLMSMALAGLVEALERAPERAVRGIEVLPEAERKQVLEEWSGTAAPYPADTSIHPLFEAQAARTPDAEALRFAGRATTYAELDEAANRLAHHLIARGVRLEEPVGVFAERIPDTIVAFLAVLKAGGCYLPLDPAYPVERLRFMLADASARIVIAPAGVPDGIPAGLVPDLLDLHAEAPSVIAQPAESPRVPVEADNVAYVIYTSGSTGTPKGVAVAHRGVPNLARAQAERFGINATSRVLQFASFSFDAAVSELFATLLTGATLVLASRDELHPGPGLLEVLRRERVSIVTLPPSVLATVEAERLPDLHTIVSAGEAVSAGVVERWNAGRSFINAYGPTEVTVCATSAECEADGRTPSIGRPLENVRVYVLDRAGDPVPVGVPGELFVGGPGVARGYLHRPEQTAERFVPDPFGSPPGGRLYRSGDRVRWRRDGMLDYLGRSDGQVKVRGFRIEPGEIEAVLSAHKEVRDAVVVVREDVPGDRRLAAYVVGTVKAEELRERLRRSLPEYMVPAAFVVLEALPLAPNGKVDRGVLRAPGHASARERYVAPRTTVEEVLAGIWAEVLGRGRIGVDDDFFELGGHSLLIMRTATRIREVFHVELPLRELFESPSLEAQAQRVEEARHAGEAPPPRLVPIGRSEPLPLSFAQERLWFLHRMEPENPFYNIPLALRVEGTLVRPALERALGEIVRRHETLRTVFDMVDGAPVQLIVPFVGFVLPVVDLSCLGEPERETEVRRRAREDASRPFDLSVDPLFRARLLRVGPAEHVLLLCMHHVVSDGWSIRNLSGELSGLYAAFTGGGEPTLPELPVQYADYAVWQREHLRGEALERLLAYWRERLEGAPALLELPTDRPRPALQTYRGAHERLELPDGLLERLQGLGRREGATLFMVLLSAFQALLGKYAGSEDVVVGSAVAGRMHREVEGLIGFFVNTLVLRTDLSGDPEFREVLRRVREVTLGAYDHQELPFERLVAELQPERSLSHSPLFQVAFAWEEGSSTRELLPGLRTHGVEADLGTAKVDLMLSLARRAEGLRAVLAYSTELFERATIERMFAHLRRVLEQIASGADVRLSMLELLGREERCQLIERWSGTESRLRAGPVHWLVGEQAARTPDADAFSFGGRTLTYREMEVAANRLAHHLVARGARRGSIVGIVADRTPETPIAVLAVLKTGAAYLPLDPTYPAERLRYMLGDSGAQLVVAPGGLPRDLPQAGLPVVVEISREADEIAACPSGPPDIASDPAELAYVVYTSGSTGRPKGVAVPHHGVPNEAWWVHSRLGLRSGDRVLQFASFSFDAAVHELFGTLLTGATLVMAEHEALLPGEPLRDTLRRERISFVTLPPSVLAVLDPAGLPDLRVVVSAGEALAPGAAARWAAHVELHNAYGPTETTVAATSGRVMAGEGQQPPIGRPLENMRVYVLDSGGGPMPVGVPGELCVGGVGIAHGYLDRPGLTAERFVPDPFGKGMGGRLYRTGDRARWRQDGTLEYLGRIDHQVKVRGYRIELGEIEAMLCRHADVADCSVVVREDTPGEKRLVAYVVGSATTEELRSHLRQSLPEYMSPAAIVRLDSLPFTPNGKLDRRALPVPRVVGCGMRPRTTLESKIATIWQELLGVEVVGVEDSFFDLGGHSLLLAQLQTRLATDLRHEVRMVDLFRYPTIRVLATHLQGAEGGGATEEGEGRGEARKAALGRRLRRDR
ncbi:MAG: amino acid adenylation domain-containing protein [Longimicrobiaceae bacterium]